MKTFIKQIENACKDYYCFNIVRTMQIKSDYENTKAAIVSIKEDEKDERHYEIYYKYNTMKKVDKYGYFESTYDKDGKCTFNAYIEACDEFAKMAF